MHPNNDDALPGRPAVELVWPGKPSSPAPVRADHDPPTLQVIERYGGEEARAVGAALAAPWRNALVRGDNLALLHALHAEPWRTRLAAAGGLRVVYLDPPFL